jgi:hypothetical protein
MALLEALRQDFEHLALCRRAAERLAGRGDHGERLGTGLGGGALEVVGGLHALSLRVLGFRIVIL